MSSVQLAIRRACEDPAVKSQANLARLLTARTGRRVSASLVQQWVDGRRPVPPRYCPAIQAITENRIALWQLQPDDWHLIWPREVSAEGAPAVPGPSNDAQVVAAA